MAGYFRYWGGRKEDVCEILNGLPSLRLIMSYACDTVVVTMMQL